MIGVHLISFPCRFVRDPWHSFDRLARASNPMRLPLTKDIEGAPLPASEPRLPSLQGVSAIPHPEQPIRWTQLGVRLLALVNGELLPKRDRFQG